jgi:ABC-type proline/glycine betaine transport system permease subunit
LIFVRAQIQLQVRKVKNAFVAKWLKHCALTEIQLLLATVGTLPLAVPVSPQVLTEKKENVILFP